MSVHNNNDQALLDAIKASNETYKNEQSKNKKDKDQLQAMFNKTRLDAQIEEEQLWQEALKESKRLATTQLNPKKRKEISAAIQKNLNQEKKSSNNNNRTNSHPSNNNNDLQKNPYSNNGSYGATNNNKNNTAKKLKPSLSESRSINGFTWQFIKADGGCLFNALSTGLATLGINLTSAEVRAAITDATTTYLTGDTPDKKKVIKELLIQAIKDFNESVEIQFKLLSSGYHPVRDKVALEKFRKEMDNKKIKINEKNDKSIDEAIMDYRTRILIDQTFWGSHAEIYAFSQFYQIEVQIFDGKSHMPLDTARFHIPKPTKSEGKTIYLDFTGDHYNLYTKNAPEKKSEEKEEKEIETKRPA